MGVSSTLQRRFISVALPRRSSVPFSASAPHIPAAIAAGSSKTRAVHQRVFLLSARARRAPNHHRVRVRSQRDARSPARSIAMRERYRTYTSAAGSYDHSKSFSGRLHEYLLAQLTMQGAVFVHPGYDILLR
ncbi:hypothetical protein [Paraburkholderia caledonica]|uniref:hypothetical protein n=1 Tax=Paraburkholderia caledonica TaxID=134536 RepID=UPI0003659C8D|nr:hypothetical protein [Paraburkholderia caledonica]TCF97280.1 hypothetical protein BZM26_32440 [Paraburkholderia strydomiana]